MGLSSFPYVMGPEFEYDRQLRSSLALEIIGWVWHQASLGFPIEDLMGPLLYLGMHPAIFWVADRYPETLARFFRWTAYAMAITSTICFAWRIGDLDPLAIRYIRDFDPRYGISHPITALLALLSMSLIVICFAGELSHLIRIRLNPLELSATSKGEAAEKRQHQRQRLIAEVLGPRTPVILPLHYAVILTLFPAVCLEKLFEIASFRRELELSAPQHLEALAKPPPGEAVCIRITASGQFLLNEKTIGAGLVNEYRPLAATLRKIRSYSGQHFISLQIDKETRHEQFVALLNVTNRLNFPIYLQD